MNIALRRCGFISMLATAFAAVPFAGPGWAAPSSVEEIANYQEKDRQAVLEAGARRWRAHGLAGQVKASLQWGPLR